MRIAFGYKMGSGKDTAVSYLISKHGGEKIAISDPVYNIQNYAQQLCGFENNKDRKFLQYIGTDWGREIDPDVWVKLAIENTPSEGNVFISDIRFLNEFVALKEEGWVCVNIQRDIQLERAGTGSVLHSSENSGRCIPWDYIIINDDTLEEFYRNLDVLIKEILLDESVG